MEDIGAFVSELQEKTIETVGLTNAVTLYLSGALLGFYFSFGTLHLLLDIWHWPKWLYDYKIQKDHNLSTKDLIDLYGYILYTSLVGGTPIIWLTAWLSVETPYGLKLTAVPTVVDLVWTLAVSVIVQEIWFFYGHYICHNKLMYRWVHWKHHTFKAPVAMAAVYAHPVEMALVNMPSLLLGPLIARSSINSALIWLLIATALTQIHHSGYDLPIYFWDEQPAFHDAHHKRYKDNYGVLGILDGLHGTLIDRFDTSKQEKSPSKQTVKKVK